MISTLNVYNLILAGMASNSRYALLGGVRSAAQMISYEIPMSICLIGMGLITNSFNLLNVISFQKGFLALLLGLPFLIIFLICAFAETNRTPFDLPEAEAEIVAGYNIEYSAILFAFFFLAEYSNIMFMSFFIILLFFGIHSFFFFFIKVLLLMLLFIFVRGVLPRYRYSQLMEIC
jgi:NADH-quinone oxidoreductase subunit H